MAYIVLLSAAIARPSAAAPVLQSVDFVLDSFRRGHFADLDTTLDGLAREDAHLNSGRRATDVVLERLGYMLVVDETLVPQLDGWRKASKRRPWAELAKAAYEVDLAWHVRGGEYADRVDPKAWPLFYSHLKSAEAALARALVIAPAAREPRAARVKLALFGQLGEAELVSRFKEAVRVDPVSPEAHDAMLLALSPKWLGDKDTRMLLTFAQDESRKNPADPYLALLVVEAHQDVVGSDPLKQVKYYRKPEVWSEVSGAMGKFLGAYPDSFYGHNLLARLALEGGQREILRRELAWIGDAAPNLAVWGVAGEFDHAKQWAALPPSGRHASPPPASAGP